MFKMTKEAAGGASGIRGSSGGSAGETGSEKEVELRSRHRVRTKRNDCLNFIITSQSESVSKTKVQRTAARPLHSSVHKGLVRKKRRDTGPRGKNARRTWDSPPFWILCIISIAYIVISVNRFFQYHQSISLFCHCESICTLF